MGKGKREGEERESTGDWSGANFISCIYGYVKTKSPYYVEL